MIPLGHSPENKQILKSRPNRRLFLFLGLPFTLIFAKCTIYEPKNL
jgi:hypothetical protein